MTQWARLEYPGHPQCYVPSVFANDLITVWATPAQRNRPTHAFIGTTTNQQQCWHMDLGQGLPIMIPVVDFENVLGRLERAPTLRTAAPGNKPYYVLQGWDQCVVLPQRHRDRLLSHMYAQRELVANYVEQYLAKLANQAPPTWN